MQLPGHGERIGEPPRHRWDDLLADVRTRLADLTSPPDRPIALFGHSLGALLAFECARILVSEHGVQPVRLLVSGHRAPHLPCARRYSTICRTRSSSRSSANGRARCAR
ncbi:thioesterase II family protein [Streptomyces rubiginosohelvolus]|uniref:thioesterase II family protein n=1 Tax=Streptomyces rubiginosohelvolus TaxID=67362 RepID=UPI0036ACDA0F